MHAAVVPTHRRRMPLLIVAFLLAIALVAAGLAWLGRGPEETTGVGAGPLGTAFYTPSDEDTAGGEHGSLIWSRRVVDGPTIGGTTHLVLYRSVGAKGETVPVSGVVSIPEGDPPDGGWPVISWGHGTTGMADQCAPSRSLVDEQTRIYTASMDAVVTDLVTAGYAVVRTDYEGLGTPGRHPYLMGGSAGAAMTDIVLAARVLEPRLSTRWVAMGHSQGGQAALFTSKFADDYSAELTLEGIIALAAPSQLASLVDLAGGGASAPEERAAARGDSAATAIFLGPLLVSAARITDVPVEDVVSPPGRALLPQLEERCIAEWLRADSFAGMTARDFVAEDADLSRLRRTVEANDASTLSPQVPVVLVQGEEDTTVPPLLSNRLAQQYERRGTTLKYVLVPDADHISLLEEAGPDVQAWVREAFGG